MSSQRNFFHFIAAKRSLGSRGFSLVEVTIAIGIVSFSALAVMGLLPVGLETVRSASERDGLTQIALQLRSDVGQIPFSATESGFGLSDLGEKTCFYSESGRSVEEERAAYFSAKFAVGDLMCPGATPSLSDHLKTVVVTVSYPMTAPSQSRKTKVFPLLIGGQ